MMSWIKGLRARARSIFGAAESRMEEEFSFHVEMETQRLVVEQGLAHDEARRRAVIAFGGMDHHREAMRDGRGARWLDDFAADVRYALRAMRHSPGFALAVAVTLGVGIGVNGLIFGYVNTVLFRTVPGRDTERLVALFNTDTRSGLLDEVAYEDYLDFRDRSGVFKGFAGIWGAPLNLVADAASAAGGTSDMVWGEMVTENYFSVIDMRPALGRVFTANDAPQGANPFAVLSFESWRTRFRGDSSVVGRVVRLNGTEFTITGVAAPGFRGMRMFGFWPEIWVPAGMHNVVLPGSTNLLQGRGGGSLWTFGRMNDGWDIERTERAAAVFARQLAAAYPATNANTGIMVLPAGVGFDHPAYVKPRVVVLASTMGVFASIVILLIICANLANLQLARAGARAREIAVRLSLGCSRARLTRQLLTESLVLAIPGALLAALVVQLGPATEPYLIPHMQFRIGLDPRPDLRVAAFTAVVGLLAAALFGLVPALRATRPQLVASLASVIGERRVSTRSSMRTRGFLVVSQIAMSVILLVAGMLFVRSLHLARSAELGFDERDRLLVSVNLDLQGYDETRARRFFDEVIARVRELPAVASAAWGFPVPFDSHGRGMHFHVEGLQTDTRTPTVRADVNLVSEGFVSALGLRLQGGREFTRGDSANAPEVMVVSRSLASRFWPGKDPIGQRARRGSATGPEVTVVGVVDDAKYAVIGGPMERRIYVPLRQRHHGWETLIVHTRGEPALVLPAIRRAVASSDPTLPTFGVMTMEQAVASGFATSRSAALISGFFGGIALLIAAVGLYAVVASGVVERTREIGVRLALGSTPAGVLRFVMQGGARLGALGLGVGLVASYAVARAMAGLLVGLSPGDPITFALVPLVLALIVVVATYLPARRAVKLDPVAALRSE